ncbi:MAG: hypothetical protein ACREE0_12250 [Phenylobacterium sp.]
MFTRGSRYEPIKEAELIDRAGRTVRYKRMRFIPETPGPLAIAVREGDRPDLVANRVFGDAEQFWRLADVNLTPRPVDLTSVPGRRLKAPGPGG